ncbi:MAG TPA: hypothetical protein VGK32_17225 [Vicinamibacterales bacterium]|jgi:cytochrome oxidase Cu insertion factor (SCO1/SenC/PrrC family)
MSMIDAKYRHRALCTLLLAALVWVSPTGAADPAAAPTSTPAVGDAARDFSLPGIDGKPITLSALTMQGPVVIIMLRGWVGYQ